MKFEVETTRLTGSGNRVKGLADEYRGLARRLINEINNGCASWQGRDKEAYITRINGFQDNLDAMYALMCQYADILKYAQAEYTRALSDAHSTANNI